MLDKELPRPKGSILYCTTGIVLQWLQNQPILDSVSHLIIDEVHERLAVSDFAMAIGKRLVKIRPDFRLIIMSATMKVEDVVSYFEDYLTPSGVLRIEGSLHKVQQFYLEDILTLLGEELDLTGRHFEPDFKAKVLPRLMDESYSAKYDS